MAAIDINKGEKSTRQGESFISAPSIVFEVVSKSTATHEYITKFDVYSKQLY
ncbi:MAG: Uma2 family endonuclease [Bacillota bacterium]|nr:Uma2 family endonuclease [Bacillota bacterium]